MTTRKKGGPVVAIEAYTRTDVLFGDFLRMVVTICNNVKCGTLKICVAIYITITAAF